MATVVSRSHDKQERDLKNKKDIIPEIIIPIGYSIDEMLDMADELGDEEPIFEEEVKIKFE